MVKKLYRNTHEDKHVAGGVFEGMGDWLRISPGILRLGFIILSLASGVLPGILLYFAAIYLLDEKEKDAHRVIDIAAEK